MLELKSKASEKTNYYLLLAVVFGGYMVFGFSENIKGPAIPRIQAELSLNEMQLGLLLSLNSLGYLLACSFTGFMSRKLGIKFSSQLAFGSMALSGVFIFLSMGFFSLAASFFLLCIGNGILEIALAILSARIYTRNTGMMMNLSHFFYGLSSTVAPLMATELMGWNLSGHPLGWRGMYLIMLSLSALPMFPAFVSRFPASSTTTEERMSIRQYARDPAAWLIVVILSFGVVSELAVGGWLVNFLEKAYKWDMASASRMLSAFFLLFMLSRLFLGPITDKIGFIKSLIIFSAFSGLCTYTGILTGQPGAFLLAAAGAGIAPIYPTTMALLARRYPQDSDTAISFTVTLMGIACVLGNFLIGAIIDMFKHLFTSLYGAETGLVRGMQAGYAFIGLCALLCSLISFILYRFLKKQGSLL